MNIIEFVIPALEEEEHLIEIGQSTSRELQLGFLEPQNWRDPSLVEVPKVCITDLHQRAIKEEQLLFLVGAVEVLHCGVALNHDT